MGTRNGVSGFAVTQGSKGKKVKKQVAIDLDIEMPDAYPSSAWTFLSTITQAEFPSHTHIPTHM